MRTWPYSKIRNWCAYKMGLDPSVNLLDSQGRAIAEYVTNAVRECWERQPWPEWTPVEQRWYRPFYATNVTYAANDEVYDATTDAYYRSIAGGNLNHPVTDATRWLALNLQASPVPPTAAQLWDRYISLDQAGLTPIGTVIRMTQDDPRLFPRTKDFDYSFSPDGIQIPPDAGTSVWLQFRKRPPTFIGDTWDPAVQYTAGQLVYYMASVAGVGECYQALATSTNAVPAADAAKWQKIDFPYVLVSAVQRMVESEMLEEEGQDDKALIRRESAEERLAMEWDKEEGQQGQERRYAVNVRGNPGSAYRPSTYWDW